MSNSASCRTSSKTRNIGTRNTETLNTSRSAEHWRNTSGTLTKHKIQEHWQNNKTLEEQSNNHKIAEQINTSEKTEQQSNTKNYYQCRIMNYWEDIIREFKIRKLFSKKNFYGKVKPSQGIVSLSKIYARKRKVEYLQKCNNILKLKLFSLERGCDFFL